jgi:hypothetical protein
MVVISRPHQEIKLAISLGLAPNHLYLKGVDHAGHLISGHGG